MITRAATVLLAAASAAAFAAPAFAIDFPAPFASDRGIVLTGGMRGGAGGMGGIGGGNFGGMGGGAGGMGGMGGRNFGGMGGGAGGMGSGNFGGMAGGAGGMGGMGAGNFGSMGGATGATGGGSLGDSQSAGPTSDASPAEWGSSGTGTASDNYTYHYPQRITHGVRHGNSRALSGETTAQLNRQELTRHRSAAGTPDNAISGFFQSLFH